MDAAASTSKRRRTSPNGETLADLPSDQLVAIAGYLPKPSRALFSVALTAPSKSFRASNGWTGELTDASKAIILSATSLPSGKMQGGETPFEELNFGDLDTELAIKLTDDDIGAVLTAINAKDSLKTLRLGRCNGIGAGLQPLRESAVLRDFYAAWDGTMVDMGVVLPILESIIDADGNNLHMILFPPDWRVGKLRMEPALREFAKKFSQILSSREMKCDTCGSGRVSHCDACFWPTCEDCNDGLLYEESRNYGLSDLEREDRPARSCDECELWLCGCCGGHIECRECGQVNCELCAGSYWLEEHCGERYCSNDAPRCLDCIDGRGQCTSCWGKLGPKLLERYEQIREENNEMKEENKELRREVEELRKKLSSDLGILAHEDEH